MSSLSAAPIEGGREDKEMNDQTEQSTNHPHLNCESNTGTEALGDLLEQYTWAYELADREKLAMLCRDLTKVEPSLKDHLARGMWYPSEKNTLAATEACAAVYRRLANNTTSFNAGRRKWLHSLSKYISTLSKPEDALAALFDRLTIYDPMSNEACLIMGSADALEELHALLSELGRHEEALVIAQERMDFWRNSSAPSHNMLAEALKDVRNHLIRLGRHDDAVPVLHELEAECHKVDGNLRMHDNEESDDQFGPLSLLGTPNDRDAAPLSLTIHHEEARPQLHTKCTTRCYELSILVLPSVSPHGCTISDPIQLLCHLQNHILKEPFRFPLQDIQMYFMVFHQAGCYKISFRPPDLPPTVLFDLLQSCLTDCSTNYGYLDRQSRQQQRALLLRLLQDMCSTAIKLPPCYHLQGSLDEGKALALGGESSVFHGTWRSTDHVAIRKPHFPRDGWESETGIEVLKSLRGEIVSHWQLRHTNVVSLLGVCYEGNVPSMVVPFMENGSAYEYLKKFGFKDGLRFSTVIFGAASGLEYLHLQHPPVIHGDLHDANILINSFGQALICDFGLSRIRHEITRTYTCIRTGGQELFIPPEISGSDDDEPRTTEAGDIYTFAMTLLKLGTGGKPFKGEYKNDRVAIRKAHEGHRPRRPETLGGLPRASFNPLWALMEKMWAHEPAERPAASAVVRVMEKIHNRSRRIVPISTLFQLVSSEHNSP